MLSACYPVEACFPYKQIEAVPEVGTLADEMFCAGAVYWICKALSINYAMAEVLHMVKKRVGRVCSIESWTEKGVASHERSHEPIS